MELRSFGSLRRLRAREKFLLRGRKLPLLAATGSCCYRQPRPRAFRLLSCPRRKAAASAWNCRDRWPRPSARTSRTPMYASMMSSTVDSSGMLIVLLIAPERNGCAAAIMRRWPRQAIERPPPIGVSEQSNTGRCSGLKPGRAFDCAVRVNVIHDLAPLAPADSRASSAPAARCC